ncbi:MAG TPA: aminotransferase class V-fold PLP-dependent enzyme [Verrucomicrobiae bacterium]|nr:aminotransferase class V-fold PLP-dependent enzyme [Verrucomicrobiae bacterium]
MTQRYVYLNHCSVSPLSSRVYNSMVEMLHGVSHYADRKFEEWEQTTALARAAAARLVNAKPHQIAFPRNTSEGLSVVANGLKWQPGDNIVTATTEFPANIYPWMRLREYGVELRLQGESGGLVDTDELLSLVDERTRMVAISWVQFATGQRLDLKRIGQFCRERGILHVVDAVQGLGALQMDVERDCVDVFAAGGHKFLLGPKGLGLLYVSDHALEKISPVFVGWTSVKDYHDYLIHDLHYRDGAVRFEGGSLNEVGITGLGQALELFLLAGPDKIEQHLLSLNLYITQKLEERGFRVMNSENRQQASAIIVFEGKPCSSEEICRVLASHDIIISARLGRVRVAPHFYNSREDIDRMMEALPPV